VRVAVAPTPIDADAGATEMVVTTEAGALVDADAMFEWPPKTASEWRVPRNAIT